MWFRIAPSFKSELKSDSRRFASGRRDFHGQRNLHGSQASLHDRICRSQLLQDRLCDRDSSARRSLYDLSAGRGNAVSDSTRHRAAPCDRDSNAVTAICGSTSCDRNCLLHPKLGSLPAGNHRPKRGCRSRWLCSPSVLSTGDTRYHLRWAPGGYVNDPTGQSMWRRGGFGLGPLHFRWPVFDSGSISTELCIGGCSTDFLHAAARQQQIPYQTTRYENQVVQQQVPVQVTASKIKSSSSRCPFKSRRWKRFKKRESCPTVFNDL